MPLPKRCGVFFADKNDKKTAGTHIKILDMAKISK